MVSSRGLLRVGLLPALAVVVGCGGSNSPDAGDAARDVLDAADVIVVPFGLESRPTNTTCRAFPRPTTADGLTLTRVFPNLPAFSPTTVLMQAPSDATRWFVAEKIGVVHTFANDPVVTSTTTFLDVRSRVSSAAGEAGLLGMAFHPAFAANGVVYLSYTAPGTGTAVLTSRISRFVSVDGGRTLDPASERVILEVPQPYENHNGGWIGFGPDGFLYASFGDGGSGGDPMHNGQNTGVLLGKILRIDVDHGVPYGIPADNPFAISGGRPEIFAYGMRNAWRLSFDRATGDLWAGDVGQNTREEIDVIRRGGNYGWSVMEGTLCYGASTCNQAGLIPPIVDYGHDVGNSVTGGVVYRGHAIPALQGTYLYADFVSGRLWGLFYDTAGVPAPRVLSMTGLNIPTFAEDVAGEVYVLNYADGRIMRLDPGGTQSVDTVPPTLSATGCVDPHNPLQPAEGLVPYDVSAPLWSDGADKERYLAIPDGTTIHIGVDGDWDLPIGSVLLKNFSIAGRRVETRLLVRHADGDWAGYTYAWNAEQTDATLLQGSETRDVGGGRTWRFPSRAECLQCHTTAAGRSLGLETAQLNRMVVYPGGREANQLATLEHIGMFDAPLAASPEALPSLPAYESSAALELRARGYLHGNCSYCHRPGGTGRGGLDLRAQTSFAATGTCNALPETGDLGVTGARVLAPGDPSRSVLSLRVHTLDVNRMPPLGSRIVDVNGTTLLDDWIRSLTTCP